MRRARQFQLLPSPELEHGGSLRKGRRKIVRPFDPKRPLHVVLRSSRAHGTWSFLNRKHKWQIAHTAQVAAQKYGVKLYRYSNVGTHLHLLVQARKREDFQAFLREISGRIAFKITGAKKGKPCGRFWDMLAYSRVVNWGRDFLTVGSYILKNTLEAFRAIDRKGADADLKMISLSLLRAGFGPPQ